MPGENLTRIEAQERASIVKVSDYKIELDVTVGPKIFKSRTTVNFTAKSGASTFIDLVADKVHSIELNGKQLDPAAHFADSRIQLPELAAENVLIVESDQAYTNTGEGLHRFVDPVDNEVYLYSQFQVPDSRRVFAVFEQPDLKAKFQFNVTAPANWVVISNQPTPEPVSAGQAGAENEKPGQDIAHWSFDETPVMSSYITAIILGPYKGVRSSLTNAEGREIPLGVYSRASLWEYVDADYIFEKTREGFVFFENEFKYPYPFAKYDQVFVPEFNAGAMENIGAVTHTEAYVFRGQVSDAIKERRVVTIIHELAHMWFGDLVTMRWWNDLWLNESFAEFMSTLATAEGTEWKDCWTTFAASEKSWAYRQDQLPSTHPIVAEIRDLEEVMVNFDGITYAKGASVLKALVAYVGRENFMRGVHEYFVKHNYSNTELNDLLVELEATSGRDLREWSKKWLETEAPNTLRADFDTEDGNFTRFEIVQTAPAKYPTLRPHRIAIGLYNRTADGIVRTDRIETDVHETERTAITELIGKAQPDLIVVNDDDLTYAKIRLDERSRQTAIESLSEITDSLTRAVLWGALWDETRDGEASALGFLEAVRRHIATEDASTTIRTVLGQASVAANEYIPAAKHQEAKDAYADSLWAAALAAKPGSDNQFQVTQAAVSASHTSEQLGLVKGLLDGEEVVPGFTVDQDVRWVLLTALAANGLIGEPEIAAELEQDNTASGKQFATRVRAAINTPEAKEAVWEDVFVKGDKPNLIVRYSGVGFGMVHDTSLLAPYLEKYFALVNTVWEKNSFAIAEGLLSGFYPGHLASQELLDAANKWLADNENAPAALRRIIKENLSDTERALNAQKASA